MARIFSYIESIFNKSAKFAGGCFLSATVLISAGCAGRDAAQSPVENEFDAQDIKTTEIYIKKLKETEKKLKKDSAPYIVMDIRKQKIYIKAGGYVLNEFDLKAKGDEDELHDFISEVRRKGGNGYQLKRIHIFKGIRMVGDMEVAAVARALDADYDVIQKYSPLDMSLTLSPGLIIEVESDGKGERLSLLPNVLESIRLFVQKLLGAKTIRLNLKTSDSMGLYGACKGRFPTLLII